MEMAEQKAKMGRRTEEEKGWLEGQKEIPALRESEETDEIAQRPAEEAGRTMERSEEFREDLPPGERMGERMEERAKKERRKE